VNGRLMSVRPTQPTEEIQASTARTYRWLERCIAAHQRTDQALFGIVQGCLPDLRSDAAQSLAKLDLPG